MNRTRTRTNTKTNTALTAPELSITIKAIESIYADLRKQHPAARPAIFIIKIDKAARGHIWFNAWTQTKSGKEIDEIMINSLILAEGPTSVLKTLIHELAHSINRGLNIQDTSRGNVYHNGKFKTMAEKLHLTTSKHAQIGITTPDISDDGKVIYKKYIDQLQEALPVMQDKNRIFKHAAAAPAAPTTGNEPDDEEENPPKTRLIKYTCNCENPRIIRAARKTMDAGPITCLICNSHFTTTTK